MEHEASRVDELVEVWVEFDVVDVGDVVGECRKRFGIANHVGGDVIDSRIGKRFLVEGQKIWVIVNFDGDAVLGSVICHGNLPAFGPNLLLVLAVDADRISHNLTNF